MRNYLFTPLVAALFAVACSQNLYADPGCKECALKSLEGQPGSKAIDALVASTGKLAAKVSSKAAYQHAFCMQYEQAGDTVDIETMFEDMEASPYAKNLNEFWTTPACHAPMKNDIKVPIIFNTATDVFKSEKFPEAVHDYFLEERKDLKTWLALINTKTSDGLTFLDFLQYNISGGDYRSKATLDAANRIVKYLCANGGVYSKYKDSVKCP